MNIHQIKITLRHIHPPIWRRIQVAGDARPGQLHHISRGPPTRIGLDPIRTTDYSLQNNHDDVYFVNLEVAT